MLFQNLYDIISSAEHKRRYFNLENVLACTMKPTGVQNITTY